ncbi:lasso peptide biosynthesis B2 protein [Rhodococcus sp. SBT000017]|uniref:lasso peptide biosynthesis B2 protein n=1 Tax=Rhodococcus sp. SBT000017 TaxID=1803385 RepID=UPI000EF859AE|nr:lasso peptide biosynthesis B2 protein [Rhodococcus sp. SBT000017]
MKMHGFPLCLGDPLDELSYGEYRSTPRLSRFNIQVLRAAFWAAKACRETRKALPVSGVNTEVRVPASLPIGSRRGVDAVLRRLSPTCLERSLVKQRWLASHGVDAEVVIGVRREDSDFTAHAWLDHETTEKLLVQYSIIHRLPAPSNNSTRK